MQTILAFGAHPDDVELSCGGTLIKHAQKGDKVIVVDLTRGELGTRGSAELRDQEAADATKIMGLAARENLAFRDGFFVNDETHQLAVIKMIRKYQPDIVLMNAKSDRHPDHGKGYELVRDACFLAGLPKVEIEGTKAHRPKQVYSYIQSKYLEPSFVVDITNQFDEKMQSIFAYKTQFFDPNSNEKDTFISNPNFIDYVKGRHNQFGKMVGVEYAEGFIAERFVAVNDLGDLV